CRRCPLGWRSLRRITNGSAGTHRRGRHVHGCARDAGRDCDLTAKRSTAPADGPIHHARAPQQRTARRSRCSRRRRVVDRDVVARWGGEEFVALLPGTDVEQAMQLAERVRAAVEHHRVVLEDGTEVGCTISIGVATCPADGSDGATLLKRADSALYRAKRTR